MISERRISRIMKEAGIQPGERTGLQWRDISGSKLTIHMGRVTPYEMRHTFVSVNCERPDGLKKMVIGHSENMDTEGTYGHQKTGDMELAAQYIDEAFKKAIGSSK